MCSVSVSVFVFLTRSCYFQNKLWFANDASVHVYSDTARPFKPIKIRVKSKLF